MRDATRLLPLPRELSVLLFFLVFSRGRSFLKKLPAALLDGQNRQRGRRTTQRTATEPTAGERSLKTKERKKKKKKSTKTTGRNGKVRS